MQEQQWRILLVEVRDGTGELRESGNLLWQITQQKLQGRNAHGEAEFGALSEDRLEVRSTVKAHDGTHIAALIQMITHAAFELAMTIRHAGERGEVTTGGGADDGDLFGVDAKR